MNCWQARPAILALIDGSLSESDRERVASHLESCPACNTFRARQLELDELVRVGSTELEPPSRIWKRIEAQVKSPPETFWRQWPRRLARAMHASPLQGDYYPGLTQALAGVALVVFSFLLLQVISEPDPHLLAEIDSYQMEVPANPFWPEPTAENPFLSAFTSAGNPFQDALRSEK